MNVELTPLEREARTLVESVNGTHTEYQVARAFVPMYAYSLPLERVTALTNALSGLNFSEENVKRALAKLVSAKVLRSRVSQGVRLWEVNFDS